jgi:hypothetical protein
MRAVILGLCVGVIVFLALHTPVFPATKGTLVLVEQRQGELWTVTDVVAKKALFGRTHKRWVEVPAKVHATIILSEDRGSTIVYTPVNVVWTLGAFLQIDRPCDAAKYLDEVWTKWVENLFHANIRLASYDRDGGYDIESVLVAAADKTNQDFEEIGVKIQILRVGVPKKMPALSKKA